MYEYTSTEPDGVASRKMDLYLLDQNHLPTHSMYIRIRVDAGRWVFRGYKAVSGPSMLPGPSIVGEGMALQEVKSDSGTREVEQSRIYL